jgi:PAS domain S-box-containing protein
VEQILALVPPLTALVTQLLLWPWLRPYAWFLFYPAIFLSARIGGLKASVIATCLSTALVFWFFIQPEHSLAHKQAHYFAAVVFLTVGIISGILSERANKIAHRVLAEISRLYDETRLAQERADLAIRGAELGAWDWNVKTGEVILSASWSEMRGYRPDEIAPRFESWSSRVHPDDWPHVDRALNDCLEGRAPTYQVEYRGMTGSGEWKWFLSKGKVFARDKEGKPVRMVGTSLDISARKRLEEALRRSEAQSTFLAEVGSMLIGNLDYADIVTRVADLAVTRLADFCFIDVVDDQGEVRRLKVSCRDLSKTWVCDRLMQIPIDRKRPHLVKSVLETRQPLLLQRPSHDLIASFSQSGEHLEALLATDAHSLMAVPLLAYGKLLGAMALISSDPSLVFGAGELRFAEEVALRAAMSIDNARLYRTAQEAIQARDDVLAIVAHDLRNPLGTILMQSGALRRRGTEPERRSRKPADMIENAAKRMNRMIEDLLDITRIRSGHLTVEQRELDTGQIVTESIEAQRVIASAASLDLHADVSEHLPVVFADRDRLLQVLENLVGNAIKFTGPGGSIVVGAAPRDGQVLFWVADTGAGISGDDVTHVFERFWQAHKEGRHGAGLGLPIVKGLVEAHGGRVWVESTPGRGSTFFFTMPAFHPDEPWHQASV